MKTRYQRMNEDIHPSSELLLQTLAAAQQHPVERIPSARRWLIPTLCLLMLLFTGTAIASDFDLTELLQRWFPDTAEQFSAVNQSVTDQGITMTLLQAHQNEDGGVELLLEFTGDMLGPLTYTDIINTPNTSGKQLRVPDLEQTHGFFVAIDARDPADGTLSERENNLYTVAVDKIILREKVVNTLHNDLDLLEYAKSNTIAWKEREHLTPGDPIVEFEDGMGITAMGFTDEGQFAIQRSRPLALELGADASALLVPADCTAEECDDWRIWTAAIDFHNWHDDVNSYQEFIFDITAEELGEYKLYTWYATSKGTIQGDWSITIDLNDLIESE